MDTGFATIVGAIIAGAASITVGLIMARAPKREVHEVMVRYPGMPKDASRFIQAIRKIAWTIVMLLFIAGTFFTNMSILALIDPSLTGPVEAPIRRLIIALVVVIAALLFCLAGWGRTILKQYED